jgi:3-hydroxyacyl-CoA dehydrogenase
LATNTSTLDVDEIASVTKRPETVVGHHFFSPANVMRLLELVRGKSTSDSVLATSMALAKRLKKVAVLSGNARGFIGNRILHPYIREAQFLVEEGASVEAVNSAIYDFGMPMGPLAMCDLIGLDVEYRIHQESRLHHKPGVREPIGIDLLYQEGRYGQKNGKGFSSYENGRQPVADPSVTERIQTAAAKQGIKRRIISREEIVDRCILAMVNEGALVLEAGTAMRAVDIDVVYLTGYGFPSYRGGLMFYADEIGVKRVWDRIEEFRATHGDDWWTPAPLLAKLAAEGKTFGSLSNLTKRSETGKL